MNCWRNVGRACSSIGIICDNVDRIKKSAELGTKVFVGVAQLPQSYQNEPYQKLRMWVSYIFIALEINILYWNVCTLYKMYIYCIYSTYILQRSVCQLVVQSYVTQDEAVNSQEMHGFWNFVFKLHDFNLHDVFQECNPGIKWDLPVLLELCSHSLQCTIF
jgi:hypothetical protein